MNIMNNNKCAICSKETPELLQAVVCFDCVEKYFNRERKKSSIPLDKAREKVLFTIQKNRIESLSDICRLTKLPHLLVRQAVDLLVEQKIIKLEKNKQKIVPSLFNGVDQ